MKRILLSALCLGLTVATISATENIDTKSSSQLPANHKTEEEIGAPIRTGRQYDSPMSTSGTGAYASVSGDSAYVGQSPSGSAYASVPLMAANYATHGDLSSNYHDVGGYSRGYSSGYPQVGGNHYPSLYGYAGSSLAGPLPPSGFSSSHSSMFPLMAKGFDVSEIICTAIAVAIGAVIVGAPFILIYLFIMNQMNGSNGPSLGPTGGGAISLTGPSSSSNGGGRRKRANLSLADELMRQLSPYVSSEQVSRSFKQLMESIAKYQV